MDLLLSMLGTMFSLMAFALIGAGVMKAFQISTDLKEAKDILRDIRRNMAVAPAMSAPAAPSTQSPHPLVQSVNAASRLDTETGLGDLDADAYARALHAQVAREAQTRGEEPPPLMPEIVPLNERR